MIIICINCNKKFNVDQKLIPDNGRQIQCGSCNHTWHFKTEILNTEKIKPEEKKRPVEKNISAEKSIFDEKINHKDKDKINKIDLVNISKSNNSSIDEPIKDDNIKYDGPENEIIFQYVVKKYKENPKDFYVFGHRHLPLDLPIETSRYINLGDWINHYSYAEYQNNNFFLKKWSTAND